MLYFVNNDTFASIKSCHFAIVISNHSHSFFKRPPNDLQNMTFWSSKHGLLDLKTWPFEPHLTTFWNASDRLFKMAWPVIAFYVARKWFHHKILYICILWWKDNSKTFFKTFFEVQYVYFCLFRVSNMLLSILSIVHLFGIEVILIIMRGY